MKNLKRVIAFICISMLMFSFAVCAVEDNEQINFNYKLSAGTSIKAGEEFTLTFFADNKSGNETLAYVTNVLLFKSDEFAFVSSTAKAAEDFDPSGSANHADVGYTAGKMLTDDVSAGAEYSYASLFTVTFKAADTLVAGNYTIGMEQACVMDANGTASNYEGAESTYKTITITVASGEEEEEFDLSYEGFLVEDGGKPVTGGFENGAQVATVFAKAEKDLAAGEYGIIFGNCKYFGAAPVKKDAYWVIKLYDPDNVLDSSKNYNCKTFTPDGEKEATNCSIETIVKN